MTFKVVSTAPRMEETCRPRHFPTSGYATILNNNINFACVDGAQHCLGCDAVNIGYSNKLSASNVW
jgi:hypothetical protein